MKKILLLFIVPFIFISCNKDEDSSSSSSPYAGYWVGDYEGDDEGEWYGTVDSDGNLVGSTLSGYEGNGTISDDGTFDIVFGTVSTGAVFTGEAQGNDYVEGQWVNGSLNGTWSGSKQ